MNVIIALGWLRTLLGGAFGLVAFLAIVAAASYSLIRHDHDKGFEESEHDTFPFCDERGRHRGIQCTCGFTASTGDPVRDQQIMAQHMTAHS